MTKLHYAINDQDLNLKASVCMQLDKCFEYNQCFLYLFVQGVMEEVAILNGDNAYNAHFGECITSLGDIDDDGYQGQCTKFVCAQNDCTSEQSMSFQY